jgi:iron complex outermembrane receptor protein
MNASFTETRRTFIHVSMSPDLFMGLAEWGALLGHGQCGRRGEKMRGKFVTKLFQTAPRARLLATAAPFALLLAGSPAFAQSAPAAPAQLPAEPAASDDAGKDIVVTGTLFRRTDTETPSPVTVLTADALDKRGISTVAEAVQRLSANNAGALPNNFTAAGAFAAGASAVSLRGLTTSSTLVLFDGLRAAYYPLADDGTRNFVDLNTIPDAIIDRIDVLKDGASSTYGADAVAGVVNIITKKSFNGFSGRVEAGISQRGDAGHQRVSGTWGFGDLDEKGFNFYVSGEYERQNPLYSADRGYPYNTADFSKLCGPTGAVTQCRTNGIQNGVNADGTFTQGTTNVPIVREYIGNTTAVGRFQLLNPALGCQGLNAITLTPAQSGVVANAAAALTNCQQDLRNQYNMIAPATSKFGASARFTAKLGENATFYVMGNYYQNRTTTTGLTQAIRNVTTPGLSGVSASTASIALPVYICARNGAAATTINNVPTTPGCTAANGTLNPQNPFAANGDVARIQTRLNYGVGNEYYNQAYRIAAGLQGTFGDSWNYSVDATAMKEDLRVTYKGYIFVQHLLDVVADGTYNFMNQNLNSQAVRDYVTPTLVNRSTSDVQQVQANLAHSFFDLPGGPLQIAVGAAYRRESVNAPSANPDANGPINRYFTINGFGSAGKRTVQSAFFEIQAPILNQVEIQGAGRYDHYSSGQSNFSPKIGIKFKPIPQIALRGTFSKGFRIPSFAESGASPTTGFITVNTPCSFQVAHGSVLKPDGTCTTVGTYATGYSLGLTTVGTPGLKPEKSTNFTAGIIINPVSWLTLTADYYNIHKKDLITGADYNPAIAAYYAGQPIPAGLTITQDVPDVSFPAAQPRIAFISYGFENANSQQTSGLDLTLDARIPLGHGIKWNTNVDATYIFYYAQRLKSGALQRYDGTLGNYQITSASGTPKWHGSWQNTVDFNGKGSVTLTTYYTSGYGEEAEDAGGVRGVCGTAPTVAYRDGTPVVCRVKSFINNDLNAQINVGSKFTFYMNVGNLLDVKPPYDPTTYGGSNYNPAWASAGILGRTFTFGAKVRL